MKIQLPMLKGCYVHHEHALADEYIEEGTLCTLSALCLNSRSLSNLSFWHSEMNLWIDASYFFEETASLLEIWRLNPEQAFNRIVNQERAKQLNLI